MTLTSLLPQEAKAVGVEYGELCEQIIGIALKKYEGKKTINKSGQYSQSDMLLSDFSDAENDIRKDCKSVSWQILWK